MTTVSLADPRPQPVLRQPPVVLAAGLALAAGTLWLGTESWRLAALLVIGTLLGVSLYHAAFGFTSAYRNAVSRRDVSGIVAQLVMLGLAMALFAPLLAGGAGGAVAPAGLQVALGSFLFGIGMQLGGGCASGTLYTVGGGNARMVVTLVFFVAGCFLGSLDLGRYADWPSLGAVSLGKELGFVPALALQLLVLVLVWIGLRRWAGDVPQKPLWGRLDRASLLSGPWPLLLGGILLAVLNFATLAVAGHPWSVTWAFTLWGAKAAVLLGWDPATSGFWSGSFAGGALARPLWQDHLSVMNAGILIGALSAAGLAGRFAPSLRIAPRSLLAAIIGGLLMGYGARLAYGCNIGAFFSGVASFSLHGWLWIVCALAGTLIGVRLRPLFGLRDT